MRFHRVFQVTGLFISNVLFFGLPLALGAQVLISYIHGALSKGHRRLHETLLGAQTATIPTVGVPKEG